MTGIPRGASALAYRRISGDEVRDWLLASAPNAAEVRMSWDDFGVALLQCGAVFTAVRISGDLVHAAIGSADPPMVSAYLRELVGGPVVADQHGCMRYYALVPVSTVERHEWVDRAHVPYADCMTDGHVGIPRPGITEPGDCFTYWCVPMDRPGSLCDPGAVSALIAHGKYRITAGAGDGGE